MVDHGERAHATWAASSTARNWHCAGALTLGLMAPESDDETIHAARGTAAHQVAEKCLRSGKDASDFLGEIEKTKKHEIKIDDELVYSAQEYVDYCRSRIAAYEEETGEKTQFWIEERFSLEALNPPFDAGGTGDFVIYFPLWSLLEIIDLKNGMGVVDVRENPQLRSYGLGAVLRHEGLDVVSVKVTIVQPRAPHKDGRIRSETFHVADLVSWSANLMKAMARSKQALDEYKTCIGNSVLMDEWIDKWLNPGKCTFCPVEGTCPKLRRDAQSVAALYFEPDTGEAKIGNLPTEMSPEKLAETLDLLPMLEDWVKAVRGYAHAQAEAGVKLPTADGEEYFLAEKTGHRKWIEKDDAAAASAIMKVTGLSEDDVFDRKLKSPAQIEKATGAKGKPKIADLWDTPVTGTNLVRSNKTSRPPAASKVEQYFEPQN